MRAVQAPAFEEVSGEIAAELQRVAIEERVKVMVDGAAVERVDQSTLNVDAVKQISQSWTNTWPLSQRCPHWLQRLFRLACD